MTVPNEIQYTLVGLVFDTDGRVLLSLRQDAENPAADGRWELSGGEIEFGETAESCLAREFREETGYEIQPFRLVNLLWSTIWDNPTKGNKEQIIIIPFYCLLKGGTLQITDPEILDVKWFYPKEVNRLDTLPGVKEIVQYGLRYKGIEKKRGLFFQNGTIQNL